MLRTVEDTMIGEESFRVLSDAEVAKAGCAWTTDLSSIMVEQSAPRSRPEVPVPGIELYAWRAVRVASYLLFGLVKQLLMRCDVPMSSQWPKL